MADEEDWGVVLDNGSSEIKVGIAGEDAPLFNFPCVIGRPRDVALSAQVDAKSSYVGDAAQQLREVLRLRYPIERGLVTDWDAMEKIWRFAYSEKLRLEADEKSLLLSEAVFNPKLHRETAAQVAFESLGVPRLLMKSRGFLCHMASGRNIALVVGVGDGVAYSMPVYEGHYITHAIRMQPTAGRDVTDLLTTQLGLLDVHLTTSGELVTAKLMKESLAYVAKDFEAELHRSNKEPSSVVKKFDLPGGGSVELGSERFRCAECLFQPRLFGLDLPGIHEMAMDSMNAVEIDVRRDLWVNIYLCGGTTLMPGFVDRMKEEIYRIAPPLARARIVAYLERGLSSWIGGSITASLTYSQQEYVTKAEYEEYGPEIVNSCCL